MGSVSAYQEFYTNYMASIDNEKALHLGLTGPEKIRVRRLYQELDGKQTMNEIESGVLRGKTQKEEIKIVYQN